MKDNKYINYRLITYGEAKNKSSCWAMQTERRSEWTTTIAHIALQLPHATVRSGEQTLVELAAERTRRTHTHAVRPRGYNNFIIFPYIKSKKPRNLSQQDVRWENRWVSLVDLFSVIFGAKGHVSWRCEWVGRYIPPRRVITCETPDAIILLRVAWTSIGMIGICRALSPVD